MYLGRSPPKGKSGGSTYKHHASLSSSSPPSHPPSRATTLSPLIGGGGGKSCVSGMTASSMSLYSTTSSKASLTGGACAGGNAAHSHNNNGFAQHYHYQHNHHHSATSTSSSGHLGTSASSSSSASSSTRTSKRNKKNNWGARERAGMSFLIVIAFFAVFGLIILTELFMIDEKSHGGMVVLRHGNLGSRLGDSLPDYDNVKEDYDLFDGSILMSDNNKLGIFQFRSDNKLKIHGDGPDGGVDAAGKVAGVVPDFLNSAANGGGGGSIWGINTVAGGGGAGGAAAGAGSVPIIPWGKILPTKIEQTLPHYPIGMQPTDGSWQVVNGTRFKFFVFSAYYDRRDGSKLVRVVGATKTRGPERVWCRFWYPYKETSNNRTKYTSATVMARVKIIRENWNLKYSACFVLCPIRMPELEVPYSVSIVSRLRAPPGNILIMRNTDQDPDFANNKSVSATTIGGSTAATPIPTGDQIPDKIAVCVKPFHFNYDQALYLMEYVEFNALLGVSHFTFYNHTIGPHATCVLNHYMEGDIPGNSTAIDLDLPSAPKSAKDAAATTTPAGGDDAAIPVIKSKRRHESTYVKPTVNIMPWNLRMRSQKEIRTEGLFAALNDCLYRTMYRYKYLALVDLDEFIIPRYNDTLNELIDSLSRRYRNRNAGAFSFQNAFFYLQFADDPLVYQTSKSSNPSLRAALVTQRKTRRRLKLHPQKQRSKYICKPESVVEAGNHFVWEFFPGKGSLNVPPDAGILHHYRVCEFGGNDCIKAPSTIDRTATKYMNRLVERVEAVYNHLKKPCDLPDLPALPTRSAQVEAAIAKINADNDQSTTLKNSNNSKNSNNNDNSTAANGAGKKKRKLIVFEESDDGSAKVKVKFVNN